MLDKNIGREMRKRMKEHLLEKWAVPSEECVQCACARVCMRVHKMVQIHVFAFGFIGSARLNLRIS